MPDRSPDQKEATLGYFTVVEDERTGWTGGLLVLDRGGRPLEFQCTLPVRPTKAHEILFGPTLRSHLVGEVIGKLLIAKCRTPVSLFCCDQPEGLAIDAFTTTPVGLFQEAAEVDERPISDDTLAGSQVIQLAGASLFVPLEKRDLVSGLAPAYRDLPDPIEPFERIREAIKEAHSQLARQRSEAA